MLIYLQMIESEEDREKFERLYKKYRWLMYSVANRYLKNPQDAEDAVHQAFVSIIENLDKIHGTDTAETRSYVAVIAERKAIDMLRERGKTVSVDFYENLAGIELELPIDGGLADAIAGLPARYREMILLRYIYGYSTGELCKMFEMSPGNIQRMLYRAKEALQKELNK